MKKAVTLSFLALLFLSLSTGVKLGKECVRMLCIVEMEMKECLIGKCMLTCAQKFPGTIFGECLPGDTCRCGISCCL